MTLLISDIHNNIFNPIQREKINPIINDVVTLCEMAMFCLPYRFPDVYILPEFDDAVVDVIKAKGMGTKYDEEVTNRITRILREDMLKYFTDDP